ncbi:MAG TPA: SpoIVB peptidase S55 domain-containing protein [Bryobacteraceae bacterium]|nr:SpoIVB peptidase S55 domain-containing protein [Bryobacteraceae bacterium]
MPRFVVPAVLALAAGLSAQTPLFPLKDIRPGMHGTGRTVFSGNRIDEFQVEILGVLENVGPKESVILARLSGGPLAETGVVQGMSGSPVYIDGKLVGAVALAFAFSKEPIAGIRPIQDMIRPAAIRAAAPPPRAPVALAENDLVRALPRPEPAMAGSAQMVDIATPISFGGFTRATLETFAPQLRALGLEPRQGVSSGGDLDSIMGNPADLKPGSMISVQLLAGDYDVGADGTVTYIDGNRVYAFGHRFLDVGATSLPFARSEVITVVPSTSTSFKLSTAKQWMGAMNHDGNTAVAGELGQRAGMVPVSLDVSREGKPVASYKIQMVNDALLSPLLVQMAVFSAIDATERTVGAATVRVTGDIEFQNAPAPVRLNNIFAADNGSAMQVSLSAAVPVAYVMQSDFNAMRLKSIALNIDAYEKKNQLTIDGITVSRHEARAGDTVQLHVSLVGENGAEVTRQVEYHVPIGAEPGMVYFTVADANTTNLTDFRQILSSTPRSPNQLITTVNNLHPNNRAYVRVWRTDPAFQLEGIDLPNPPASVALILAGSQSSLAGITQTRNSKIAEMEIDAGDAVISGSKTVQVEIKE